MIIREHLPLLQNHQVPELARRLELSVDEVTTHIEIIRHLDPTPGTRHNPSPAQYVIPDVYVTKVEGEYVAVLNDDVLPQLRISPVYRRMLDKNSHNSDETRSYVKEKFRSALWLNQVRRPAPKDHPQDRHQHHHVSTRVSRPWHRAFAAAHPQRRRERYRHARIHGEPVVNNKYMHTPQGVVEMKYFFHSGIHSAYGESVSSVTIKQRIRTIIDAEDTRRPLSDSRVVDILQHDGLILARRTIAKYREELRIPRRAGARCCTDRSGSAVRVERTEERTLGACPRAPCAQRTVRLVRSHEPHRWRPLTRV